MLDAIAPGGRDRRLVSAILVLGHDRPVLRRGQPGRVGDRLLRRRPAGVLPGLAARVHHQPGRHPHRRPHPAPAARAGHRPRVHGDRRSPDLPDPRRGAGALDLDHPVRERRSRTSAPTSARSSAPMQGWLDSIGLGQVDLATQALAILDNLDEFAAQLIVPLQAIAVASVGADRHDADRVHPVDLHGHRP